MNKKTAGLTLLIVGAPIALYGLSDPMSYYCCKSFEIVEGKRAGISTANILLEFTDDPIQRITCYPIRCGAQQYLSEQNNSNR